MVTANRTLYCAKNAAKLPLIFTIRNLNLWAVQMKLTTLSLYVGAVIKKNTVYELLKGKEE